MEQVKKKGRPRGKNSLLNYFNEDDFRENILPLVKSKKQLPNSFVKDIFSITDGMINTEFRNNVFVLNNREELKQECFFEVLKSLDKFNCQKGRSFAYFNRIIKNTLLKIYYKNNKINSKELKVLDITKDVENSDDLTMDEAFTIINDNILFNENDLEQNSSIFYPAFDCNLSKENKRLKTKQNHFFVEYSIYIYLKSLVNFIDDLLSNKETKESFLNYIKYSNNVDISYINREDAIQIIEEAKSLFNICLNTISSKIQSEPDKYKGFRESSIFINNNVLVYIKNKISNKNIRKSYKKVVVNTVASAKLIISLLDFYEEKRK